MRDTLPVRPYAMIVGALLVALVAYGISTGSIYGYVIGGVLLIFFGVPMAVVGLASRRGTRAQRTHGHNGHDSRLDADMQHALRGPDQRPDQA